jgi:DNA-binding MarR family transcriptional regulator
MNGEKLISSILLNLLVMGKKQPKLKFETLKGRAQDIVMRLMNSIALQNEDCCTIDDFAEEFKTTPGRLKPTLNRLEEAGLITLSGDVTQLVVPTVKLLRDQDRHLSENQAVNLIRQYKRGRYK